MIQYMLYTGMLMIHYNQISSAFIFINSKINEPLKVELKNCGGGGLNRLVSSLNDSIGCSSSSSCRQRGKNLIEIKYGKLSIPGLITGLFRNSTFCGRDSFTIYWLRISSVDM
jgi:hypothetical protein